MFFTMCVTITIGPTTLHTECCPGTNSSLTESLPNFWKAIGIYLVDGGKRHNDYDSQCKVFPFLLTPGIKKKKKARTGRFTESTYWVITVQLTALGEKR